MRILSGPGRGRCRFAHGGAGSGGAAGARPVRLGFRRARLLGDGALRDCDGDRLVRRPPRPPQRAVLGARLAARSGRRQAAGALGAHRPRRPGVFAGWVVAAIVARELLVSGLRLAALERGVVLEARDLGKVKTWAQAVAAGVGGFAAAGAWDDSVASWALLVALVLTWVSGLDYARLAPRLLRARPVTGTAGAGSGSESRFSSNPASRQPLR